MKIDGGDSICISGGSRIQVAQPRYIAGLPGMTNIPTVYYHIFTVVPGRTAWFSAENLGRGPGYVRNSPKAWTMSLLLVLIT